MVDGRTTKTVTVGQAEHKDYSFDVDLVPGVHEIAAAFLNDALVGNEDRNLYLERITIIAPQGAPDPTLPDIRGLAEAAEARERQAVAATQAGIEKHRKADAKIRIVNAAGLPVAGAKIQVEQTGHDFLFGSNIYMFDRYRTEAQNAAYKRRFQELFNYATVGFYWRWYERERGKPNYQYTDKVVAWCLEHVRGEVLPRVLCPSGNAGDHVVGLVRPGLLPARRENAPGRHDTRETIASRYRCFSRFRSRR